jgi:hypothetical protein
MFGAILVAGEQTTADPAVIGILALVVQLA